MQGLRQAELEIAKSENLFNKDIKEKDRSVLSIIRKNFLTFFNALNLLIAVLLLFARSYRNLLFLMVVVSNTLIGTIQEIRAKQIRNRLELLNKNKVTCIRGGIEIALSPEEIALYDLLLLRRGNQIPTDCEVEEGRGAVDESLVTGESDNIDKQEGDLLTGGSFVTEGVFYARVTAVSGDCYIKRLQLDVRKDIRPKSKLLEQINIIIKASTILICPVGLLLFFKLYSVNGTFAITMPQVAAALIGMIPSGLVLLTSVALAIGIINLAKQNVLVNELNAIENLARVDTLCLDKTGTITSGKMKLEKLHSFQEDETVFPAALRLFLANKAEENDTLLAIRNGLDYFEKIAIEDKKSISFSSERKWSSAFVSGKHYVLGAPHLITNNLEVLVMADALSKQGKRVLLFSSTVSDLESGIEIKLQNLEHIGLLEISDCLRENIKDIISYFYAQDVNVKVISGDNLKTVCSIAKQVGIKNVDQAIDNAEINDTVDVENLTVFGRVSPQNKQVLLSKLIEKGHCVAMTGDGINDMPAMKISNCSIAMGSGNDATKNLAQIVLLKNQFEVMPSIVNEGRRIINNISLSASLFLNKTIFSAILSLICVLFSLPYPFQPIQLTLISTLTIGLPSFFLTFEPNKKRVQGNFLINVLKNSLPTGISVSIAVALVLIIARKNAVSRQEASTLVSYLTSILLTLSLIRICYPFNPYRFGVLAGVILSLLGAIFFIKNVFYFVPLGSASLIILVITSVIGVLMQLGLNFLFGRYLDKKQSHEEV